MGQRSSSRTESSRQRGDAAPVELATLLRQADAAGWHSHRRLQWIAPGEGLATVETEEALWAVLPGHAFVIGSSLPHNLSWQGSDTLMSVYLEPGTVRLDEATSLRTMRPSSLLSSVVAALIEEPRPYQDHLRGSRLVGLLLDEINRNAVPCLGLPTPTSRSLRTLCRQLRERPADQRDIDAWAETLGLSRRTLTRRFREETGMSFVEWRQRARAMTAAALTSDGVPPKQIASDAGFASVQAMRAEVRRFLRAGGST